MTWATLGWAALACFYAEFVGYWLHVLLHSDKIEFLSRNHMLHHLVVYAPDRPMRPSRDYLVSTYGRASLLGLGLEWIVPAAVLLPLTWLGLRAAGAAAVDQAVFLGVTLAWSFALFNTMHDAMHLKGFWMERSPWLCRWFLRARKRHDIHHMRLDDWGRMRTNYGICFFLFDRLFGTLAREHETFNHAGLAAARQRYAFIFM